MRSEAVHRAHVARPRRDTIAVTLPRNALWIGAGAGAALALLIFLLGWSLGRWTAEAPAPVSTQGVLDALDVDEPPAPPEPPVAQETPPPPSTLETPAAPPPKLAELDLKSRAPAGRYGIQLGAFPGRDEALAFVRAHPDPLASLPIHLVPSKGHKGGWYRVRVGSYGSDDAAERVRRALPDDLAKGSMVVRYR